MIVKPGGLGRWQCFSKCGKAEAVGMSNDDHIKWVF
jgi:hypothetical protein